jgi:hypothetical protein
VNPALINKILEVKIVLKITTATLFGNLLHLQLAHGVFIKNGMMQALV